MNLFFKALMIVFLSVPLISCNKRDKPLSEEDQITQNSVSKKATEEEIKYFFPGGEYDIYITNVNIHAHLNSKWYIHADNIEENINVVDQNGNVVDLLSLLELIKVDHRKNIGKGKDILVYPKGSIVSVANIFTLVESDTEYDYFFRTDVNIENHEFIEESYTPGRSSKRYCKEAHPDFTSKEYIFDDKLLVRLYDKNNKIISENQMRRHVSFDNFDPDFAPKIQPHGRTDAWLIGMLELPPKSQRGGLKYRVVRVDENGNPRPFLWDLGKPYDYYHLEKPLEPYSEYSTWEYHENSGCYIKVGPRPPKCPPPLLCSG